MGNRQSLSGNVDSSSVGRAGQRQPLRQITILAGVLILIGAILFFRTKWPSANSAAPVATSQATPTASPTTAPVKATATAQPAPPPDLSPEAQLEQLLKAGEPVFIFFYSNSCPHCAKMTKNIEQVYPDFSDSVPLVNVDVYDDQNLELLQRVKIRSVPTLIFVDREGEVEGHAGVMEPDALQEKLEQLSE